MSAHQARLHSLLLVPAAYSSCAVASACSVRENTFKLQGKGIGSEEAKRVVEQAGAQLECGAVVLVRPG